MPMAQHSFSRKLGLAIKLAVVFLSASALLGCATGPTDLAAPIVLPTEQPSQSQTADALPQWMAAAPWQHQSFPTKRSTRYRAQQLLGRDALEAMASNSMSVMRKKRTVPAHELGRVQFSWVAKQLIDRADITARASDDAVLRVVLTFEGDRSRFSLKNQLLSELSHTLTGEELPYATLMYVWCNKRPAGEVILNPRTDRIRKLVVESGRANLGQWLDYERDIRADFKQAFGEEPGALTSIALMTDTDNTQSDTTAWYGPVRLLPRQ
jgi:Protein of unknown function (DUF3047)